MLHEIVLQFVILFFVIFVPHNSRVATILPDVSTIPSELGFKAHAGNPSVSTKLYFIQPKSEGTIVAQLGPHTSEHHYKMASISVFLNTYVVNIHRVSHSPLFALCVVENSHLIAQEDIILLCNFRVHVPSFSEHIYSNSSCLINCVNESECAAQLDLDFIRMQSPTSHTAPVPTVITYNVTAHQVIRERDNLHYVDRPDITESLIQQSQTMEPVFLSPYPEISWYVLDHDAVGIPRVQIGIPAFANKDSFPLLLSVLDTDTVEDLKLRLYLSSTLRYRYEQSVRSDRNKQWRTQVTSKRYGAMIQAQKRYTDIQLTTTAQYNTTMANAQHVIIANLVLEEVIPVDGDKATPIPDSDPDDSELEDNLFYLNQPFIHLKLLHLYPANVTRKNKKHPSLLLTVPQKLPKPDDMHIFVQFEPRDILEPPWSPAIPSPEPYKLRVFSLQPHRARDLSGKLIPPFSWSSAGRLTDITQHVFCRKASLRHSGGMDRLFDVGTSTNAACPTAMLPAPIEVEHLAEFVNSPLKQLNLKSLPHVPDSLIKRAGSSNQLVLALPATLDRIHREPSIMPSIYGSVRSSSIDKLWSWREWRGPTVRRWMLESFRIHVSKTNLKRISGWRIAVPDAPDQPQSYSHTSPNRSFHWMDRFEQAAITVTARIYTMLPGTGQRIYLGSVEHSHIPHNLPINPYSAPSSSNMDELTKPMDFDVTRLLPLWALVVRPVLGTHHTGRPLPPSAYIYHETFSLKPYLIGQWPGRVMLSLVATAGDQQPLASTYVDVDTSAFKGSRSDKSVSSIDRNHISIAAIRTECVDPYVRLTGHLSEAALVNGEDGTGFVKLTNPRHPSADPFDRDPQFANPSLPDPQQLHVQLHRLDSSSNVLITGAAASATRSPQFFQSLTYQSNLRNPNKYQHRTSNRSLTSSSAQQCPLHLLSLSLILTDGSVVHAHTVPEGQLRIGVYGTNLVWDPSVPIRPDQISKTSRSVSIDQLVVWSSVPKGTSKSGGDSVPLGAMDKVVVAVQTGGQLLDPGKPSNIEGLFVKLGKPKDQTTHANGQSSSDRPVKSNERANVLTSNHQVRNANLLDTLSNSLGKNRTTFVTYIIVGVGCLFLFLLAINGVIFFAVRKRRHRRDRELGRSNSHLFGKNHSNFTIGDGRELLNAPNGVGVASSVSYHSSRASPETYRSQGHTPLLTNHNVAPQMDPTIGSVGFTYTGSGNSRDQISNLNRSVFMDPKVSPYILSPTEANTFQNVHPSLIAHYNEHILQSPFAPRPCSSPSGNNSLNQFNYTNQAPPSNQSPSTNINRPCRLSPGLNGYTSGIDSIGTAEGCSDEGLPGGFELLHHLPQSGQMLYHPMTFDTQYSNRYVNGGPIAHCVTVGTNSTASGHSNNDRSNRQQSFKQNGTGVGCANSLSGESSAADMDDCRKVKRPDVTGMSEQDLRYSACPRSPIRYHAHQQPIAVDLPSPKRIHNPMTESFTRAKAYSRFANPSRGRSQNLSEDLSMKPAEPHILSDSSEFEQQQSHESCISQNDSLSDVYPPVPLPPKLLLNSRVCHGSVSSPTHLNHAHQSSGIVEVHSPFGAYKRSDSFGMATKQGLLSNCPTDEDYVSGAKCGRLNENEMVGDLSDDVSSESKSSSAIKKGNHSDMGHCEMIKNTLNHLVYTQQVPPPEL